jgi:Transglycosylase-like domain
MKKVALAVTLTAALFAPSIALADDGDYDTDDYGGSQYVSHSSYVQPAPQTTAVGSNSSVVSCILRTESGNGTTSSNLAQFQQSTWLAYGGAQYAPSPDQASPAQQIAMVNHVLSTPNGISNWAPYDGC